MNKALHTLAPAGLALVAASGIASADYLFSFEGTITSSVGPIDHAGTAFTLNMFILDVTADQTAAADRGTYAIAMGQIDIGSNGTFDETFSPEGGAQSLYIDNDPTQLIGAFDLSSPLATFLLGVNVPTNPFSDPNSLSGQSNFTLSGLNSSTFSFFKSAGFDLVLDVDSFSFDNNVTVVPLPAAGIAGFGLLGAMATYRRARK